MSVSEALDNLRTSFIDVYYAFREAYVNSFFKEPETIPSKDEELDKVEICIDSETDNTDQVENVQDKINEFNENVESFNPVDEGLETHWIDGKHTYWYMSEYMGFKTKNGKKIFHIIPSEALDMIEMHLMGRHHKTIYNYMINNRGGFHHGDKVKIGTVQRFLERYDEGLLDFALRNICNNPQYGVNCPSDYYRYPGNVLAYEEKIRNEGGFI